MAHPVRLTNDAASPTPSKSTLSASEAAQPISSRAIASHGSSSAEAGDWRCHSSTETSNVSRSSWASSSALWCCRGLGTGQVTWTSDAPVGGRCGGQGAWRGRHRLRVRDQSRRFRLLEAVPSWTFSPRPGVVAAGVYTSSPAAGARRYVAVNTAGVIFYSGLAVDPRGTVKAHRADALAGRWADLRGSLEGRFCIASVPRSGPVGVEVMLDPLGLEQVFTAEFDGGTIISNSVGVFDRIGVDQALDPLGLSLLVSVGWVGADRTLRARCGSSTVDRSCAGTSRVVHRPPSTTPHGAISPRGSVERSPDPSSSNSRPSAGTRQYGPRSARRARVSAHGRS